MACDHNFARIPDEENTEGGRGVFLLRFLFILCDGFLYDLFCVSFVTNLFKKSCLFQKKNQLQDERREQHV